MICKKCGHEDFTGAAFCPKCGERLEENTVQAAPVITAASAPKKNTAKIIIIVAVIVALLAGAGVVTYFGFFAEDPWFVEGKAKDGEAGNAEDGDHSEDAKAAVEEIMDGVVDYDQEVIEDELDIEWVDMEAALDEAIASMGEMGPFYEPTFDLLLDKYFGSYKYEIGDIEEKDDKYTVAVKFSCIDMEAADEAMNEVDGTATGEKTAEDLYAAGKITEDMSQEEALAIVMDESAKALADEYEKALDSVDTKTMDLKFVVVEKDGEWVVDTDESDYEELKEEIESLQ